MGFKGAVIKNFRHFTDLTVQNIPDTARLIVLVGPNGCGKSSFFDALHIWGSSYAFIDRTRLVTWEIDYHYKIGSDSRERSHLREMSERWQGRDIESMEEFTRSELRRLIMVNADGMKFHLRSPYRNDSTNQIRQFGRARKPVGDADVRRMIDNDVAVASNYAGLINMAIQKIFDPADESMALEGPWKQVIVDIRKALLRLFPDVQFDGLGNPLEDGTFLFSKGMSRELPFKNLASGERAAFDLILGLIIATIKADTKRVLFCIDEPDSHMHARLQAELLSVLYDLIPENCQLMLATHSIGMMRRARDIEAENPGSVVFLDFGDRDFDQPQVIEPTKPDRKFWKNAYDVALDDLAVLVAPERVVICEGEPKNRNSSTNYSHDARCYERIFGTEFPETQFVPGGNASEVADDKRGIAYALGLLTRGIEIVKLIDRDDRSAQQVADLSENKIRVLSRRNLESYLFDDEVLKTLATSVCKEDKTEELLKKKQSILANRPNNPPDDLKPVSGEIYVACKDILNLTQCGNDAKTFMRDTLAPLIKPEMRVYKELKRNIFDSQTDS